MVYFLLAAADKVWIGLTRQLWTGAFRSVGVRMCSVRSVMAVEAGCGAVLRVEARCRLARSVVAVVERSVWVWNVVVRWGLLGPGKIRLDRLRQLGHGAVLRGQFVPVGFGSWGPVWNGWLGQG